MAYRIDDYINTNNSAGNAMAQRRRQDADTWKTMLTQINNTRPDTMLGFGLGKLLRGAWDHRKRRAAQKDAENRNHRAEVSGRAAANAGLAPATGLLGDGFDVARGFQVATGGNNPIAWNAYGEATRAQKPSAEAPVEATTTVQVAQNTPTPTFNERVKTAVDEMNLQDWWNKQIPLNYLYGRQ